MLKLEGLPRKRGQVYGETLRAKIHAMVEELKEYIETLKVLIQPRPALQYVPVKAT